MKKVLNDKSWVPDVPMSMEEIRGIYDLEPARARSDAYWKVKV